MDFIKRNRELLSVQLASISALPAWYPFFANHLRVKSEILLESKQKLSIGLLYRGIVTTSLLQPLFPLAFAVKNLATVQAQKHGLYNKQTDFGITMLTGMSTVAVANPIDVIILKRQQGKSNMDIIKTTPIRDYYKGSVPFAMRNGIFFCGLTSIYSHMTSIIPFDFGAAVLTSVLCNFLIVPLDLSSVMRQSSNYHGYNARQCIYNVYQQKGIRGLFAGYMSRSMATATEIFLFNYLKKYYETMISEV